MYIYRYVCLAKRKKNLIWSIEWTEEKPTKKNSLVRCTEARDENECCDCCHSEWRLIFSTVLKILKEVKVWFFFFWGGGAILMMAVTCMFTVPFSVCYFQVIVRKWHAQEERLIKLREEEVTHIWLIELSLIYYITLYFSSNFCNGYQCRHTDYWLVLHCFVSFDECLDPSIARHSVWLLTENQEICFYMLLMDHLKQKALYFNQLIHFQY